MSTRSPSTPSAGSCAFLSRPTHPHLQGSTLIPSPHPAPSHRYIVYCVWLAFELAFVWKFLIETKVRTRSRSCPLGRMNRVLTPFAPAFSHSQNRTLEETAALFDGEDALEDLKAGTAGVVQASGSESPDAEKEKGGGLEVEHVERV